MGFVTAPDLRVITDNRLIEDQQKINSFSKLNTRMKGFEAKVDAAKVN